MKSSLTFLLTILSLTCFAQLSSKTLTKTVIPEAAHQLKLDFKDEVDVITTQSSRVICELEVKANVKPSLLEFLVKQGRYDIRIVKENETLTLMFEEELDPVIIKGKDLEEFFKLTLYVPEDFQVHREQI